MATSVVVTCRVTVHDCRAYVVLVRLQRFTPSEEFFTKELLVCIYCCLGCTYRYMGNSLSFLNSGFKTGLVSTVMFETCSVLSLSSVEVPHIRFKIKDVRLNKPFNALGRWSVCRIYVAISNSIIFTSKSLVEYVLDSSARGIATYLAFNYC